ncbi:MAG: peptidylprolyl isomerase [Pseudomonadota bacterium]
MTCSGAINRFSSLLIAALAAWPVFADGLFDPVARVNDAIVTEYEVEQRQRFLSVLDAPVTTREATIETLIDDRLRSQAVQDAGIELTEEGVAQSLAEFAGRAELTTEAFIANLREAGVDEETFRDFVVNSVGWRELIRGLYLGSVDVTDAEVDEALATSTNTRGINVLLSEVIIPAPEQEAEQAAELAQIIAEAGSQAEFSDLARQYSATASRGDGGRLPWTPVDQLPPSLQPIILGLVVGEVTAPLPIPNAIALFQLRGIREGTAPRQIYAEIEYATYAIPGGRSAPALAVAAQVRATVDGCKDLYKVAQGQPEQLLEITAQAPAAIPRDIAIELAKLDPGESSVALTRSNEQTLLFLMLCKRTATENAGVTRAQAADALRQRKLQDFADALIAQLRADARILRP